MSHTPYEPTDESDARAAELRELAGPVTDTSVGDQEEAAPANSPDALSDPDVDEVRANEGDDVVPDEVSDPYANRSMTGDPSPSADDPGGSLNF